MKKRLKFILLAIVIVVLAALSLVFFETAADRKEQYEVYSAYLAPQILEDAHDWGVDVPIQVVIDDRTILSRGNPPFEQMTKTARLGFRLHNLLSSSLEPRFQMPKRAKTELAHDIENIPDFEARFPHGLGYLKFSEIGFNVAHTQAVFYVEHICGLCGGGKFVLMEKTGGSWRIVAEHYTWVS